MLTLLQNIEEDYTSILRMVKARTSRLVVCTIYEPPLSSPDEARLARVPLAILNDRIIRTATRFSVDVLELRGVCTDVGDFVQEIEPSAEGARKIAAAIAGVVRAAGGGARSRVYAG